MIIQSWKQAQVGNLRRRAGLQRSHDYSIMETVLTYNTQAPSTGSFNGAMIIQSWKPLGAQGASTISDILQRSHDYSIMETPASATQASRWSSLQRSHDYSIMETLQQWYLVLGKLSFNGAMIIQSWKPCRSRTVPPGNRSPFNGAMIIQSWKLKVS